MGGGETAITMRSSSEQQRTYTHSLTTWNVSITGTVWRRRRRRSIAKASRDHCSSTVFVRSFLFYTCRVACTALCQCACAVLTSRVMCSHSFSRRGERTAVGKQKREERRREEKVRQHTQPFMSAEQQQHIHERTHDTTEKQTTRVMMSRERKRQQTIEAN